MNESFDLTIVVRPGGESVTVTLKHEPIESIAQRWSVTRDGASIGVIAASDGAWLSSSSSRIFSDRADAIRSLVPNSSMTTPRWVSASHKAIGPSAEFSHLVAPIASSAPCGASVPAERWRLNIVKPQCPECLDAALAVLRST